ncbi:MAG: 2-amino-3,7-dideoxy-D-threo-hept-6-ulosonate synthase [Thermodesulfobacteriota bacterium]
MDGKSWRLRRIVNPHDGKTVILPLDHGLSMGPVAGLESPVRVFSALREAPPDAVVLHKGLIRFLPEALDPRLGLIVHLSGATELNGRHTKRLVTGVDEALALGADGVSVHVNFGGPDESDMLVDLGTVADRCAALRVPLLVMAYLRGGTLPELDRKGLALAARACAELGADIVKLPWPGSRDAMAEIVAGCPVGIVVAGGPAEQGNGRLGRRVAMAMDAGAAGIAAGRNVFQSSDPVGVLRSLAGLVHTDPGQAEAWNGVSNGRGVSPARSTGGPAGLPYTQAHP